jgi:hypothetical protein
MGPPRNLRGIGGQTLELFRLDAIDIPGRQTEALHALRLFGTHMLAFLEPGGTPISMVAIDINGVPHFKTLSFH